MTNQELISKLKEDMEMRGFSHYTKDSYLHKAGDIIKHFKKPMEEVSTKELRNYLLKYLKEKKGLSERTVNYYNSIIRFMYEVTLDKLLNKKQLPMYRKRRKVPKILTEEELSIFFNACNNYMYKTIFMLIYGSGLRISEAANLRVEDINSEKMRVFIRNGKGKKERYTILSKTTLEMLREYFKRYKPNHPEGYLFLNSEKNPIKIERIRLYFRTYRTKCKLDSKLTVHSLRHDFATHLIEAGATLIQVKELLGHNNIRSTMEYIHISKIDTNLESPLDILMRAGEVNA